MYKDPESTVLGETGQIVRRAQVRTIDEMMRTLESLPDRFEVCYEASCGYGHFHDLLRPLATRVVVVAHPGQPTTPLAAAGMRIELPVSVPVPSIARLAVTAVTVPPEEPPGLKRTS